MSLLRSTTNNNLLIETFFLESVRVYTHTHTHTHTQNTTDQYAWISKQVIHSPRQNSGYKMNKLNMRTI